MKKISHSLARPYIYSIVFTIVLLSFTAYALLDTFVIPHSISEFSTKSSSDSDENSTDSGSSNNDVADNDSSNNNSSSTPVITDTSYQDDNISITIETLRVDDTNVYIADIQISSIEYLQTALADNSFGTNITEKTSSIAASNNAILAINGDYYGANKSGYVIKNGTVLRTSVRGDTEYDDLVLLSDGTFEIVNEKDITTSQLLSMGTLQLFAFGPTLVENQTVAVSTSTEVDQSMSTNPRTAIGIIEPLHYIFVVSDGRTSENTGLSLYQLAQVMADYGCETAYNLDGGGSSTMYFNGTVINNPTTSGKKISERAVSDIVYIGY